MLKGTYMGRVVNVNEYVRSLYFPDSFVRNLKMTPDEKENQEAERMPVSENLISGNKTIIANCLFPQDDEEVDSHEEIWDDTALIKAYDRAVQRLKVFSFLCVPGTISKLIFSPND